MRSETPKYVPKDDTQKTVNHWVIKPSALGLTAEDLWKKACEHWEWQENHPVYKPEVIRNTGEIKQIPIPRPFTVAALCLHCGITYQYLKDISKNPDGGDFYLVAQRILQVIYTQKLENAIAGVYNAPIVARELRIGEGDATGKLPAVIKIYTVEGSSMPLLTNEQDAKEQSVNFQKSNLEKPASENEK